MICNCNKLTDDYSIEVIQGDYASVVFTITDEFDDKIDDIKQVVFTCKRLGIEQVLQPLSDVEFMLVFSGDTTMQWPTYTGITYDITLELKGSTTPLTLVHDASLSVLKKENPLNDDNTSDVQD